MKISHNWLKELVDFRIKPAELSERLSMLGLEVESFEDQAHLYDKFVVGEIVEIMKHPNADRLTLCKVDVGKESVDIVCGAPNVALKQKVAVALVGATISHTQHDPDGKPFVLERAKIRGVESNGMICSAYELGLGDDKDGIVALDSDAKIGTPLAKHLRKTDVIYEIEITANRGDWLSHIGVAREVGALVGKHATLPKIKLRESKIPITEHAKIRIVDRKKCLRYVGRVVRNVEIKPSPQWLQDRLLSVGIRPINNIVDITNYVLMGTGQPLHAFDFDRLAEHTIVVKCAKDGDRFTTLDGKERILNSETLLICDAEKPVAIAGVMGGRNSEISDNTQNIFIESAYFLPTNIRQTSKYLVLSTDASQRFERGVDIDIVRHAADKASELMQQLAGGDVLRGVIDVYPKKTEKKQIRLRVSRANAILGTFLTKSEIISLLKRLELTPVSQSKDWVVFSIPSFRNDLVEEIDLIEEAACTYGYNNIETKNRAMIDFSRPLESKTFDDDVRSYLAGAGFNEIMTLSLQDKESASLTGEWVIDVLNPVSVEAQCLRPSLIPGALQVVRHNMFRGQKDLRLFEIGSVFSRKKNNTAETLDDILEEQRLLIVLTGKNAPPTYGANSMDIDLFDLKGEVEALLGKFVLDKYRFISYDNDRPLTDKGLSIEINGTYAGFLGKIRRSITERFEIESDIFVCELKLEVLGSNRRREKKFTPLPRFPKVSRDIAFIVDQYIAQENIERTIREVAGKLLEQIRLFDVYTGEQVGAGNKSLAYSLEFQPEEKTLTDDEVDQIIASIIAHVEKKYNAQLRAM